MSCPGKCLMVASPGRRFPAALKRQCCCWLGCTDHRGVERKRQSWAGHLDLLLQHDRSWCSTQMQDLQNVRDTKSHKVSQYGHHHVCLQFVAICLFRYAESNQYVRVICAIASLQTCENYTCFPASKRPKQGKPMVPNSSDEQQLLGFTPRYAEHFVGAAALIGAFALVFGAMALGQNVQSTYCLQYVLEQAC